MEIDEVIARVKNGEDHCFAYIIKHYEQKVFTTVIRIVRNRTVAEDIIQDIFIKVYYNLHKYEKKGRLMHGSIGLLSISVLII